MTSRVSTDTTKVYLGAAQFLALQHDVTDQNRLAACWAVDVVANGGTFEQAIDVPRHGFESPTKERTAFNNLFYPSKGSKVWRWGNQFADTAPERRDCLILALCFMAAMVEAGDA